MCTVGGISARPAMPLSTTCKHICAHACVYMDACVTPHASGVNDIILFRVQVNFITLDNGPI